MRRFKVEDWLVYTAIMAVIVGGSLIGLVSGGDSEPKFKYGETLKITGGFYEGQETTVDEYDDGEYSCKIGTQYVYIKEEHLARSQFKFDDKVKVVRGVL